MNFVMITIKSNYKENETDNALQITSLPFETTKFFVIGALRPTVVQGLLIHDVSRTRTTTNHTR